MDELTVAPVDPLDATACEQLRGLVEDYVWTWYEPGSVFSYADKTLLAALPEPYTAPVGCAFLAYDSGVPVACLLAIHLPDRYEAVEVRKMYASPASRGRGAGRALLDAAQAFAQATDAYVLVLSVHEDRLPARRLYESAGYGYDHRDDDGFWHMSKPVESAR